jgi:threonine dehydrogenase-like Zn-dependent dehydrogenase
VRAVRYGAEGPEVIEVEEPEPPGPDWAVVEVAAVGICGTDLALADRGLLRVVPGHEIGARLEDDGTPVAVEPLVPCGRCDACRRGEGHLCRDGPAILLGVGRDGGMAERVAVPRRALVPLPGGVRPEDASLVEPLAVAVHGLRLAGLLPGQRVAVVGGGAIGLCAALAAARSGAEVAVEARHEAQRRAAEALGARVGAAGEYDLVVDAAGSESGLVRALDLLRPGGSIVVLALHWGLLPLPYVSAALKEARVLASTTYGRHGAARDVDDAAALLAAAPEAAEVLVTHRFALGEAARAFETARARAAGAIKVVVEPSR